MRVDSQIEHVRPFRHDRFVKHRHKTPLNRIQMFREVGDFAAVLERNPTVATMEIESLKGSWNSAWLARQGVSVASSSVLRPWGGCVSFELNWQQRLLIATWQLRGQGKNGVRKLQLRNRSLVRESSSRCFVRLL